MTTDKISGKAAQLRSMIIKAWRERWTASQYGTQVCVGRDVSVINNGHYYPGEVCAG